MGDQKIMKDISLNKPVSITLPAHVWLVFLGQYGNSDWESAAANQICVRIQEAIMDPIFVNEKRAEAQAAHDAHDMVFQQFMGPEQDDPRNDNL